MAYGVLELEYSEERSVEENIPIALKAMTSAMGRDTATGDGINLVTITEEGFKEYKDEEVDEYLKKIPKK